MIGPFDYLNDMILWGLGRSPNENFFWFFGIFGELQGFHVGRILIGGNHEDSILPT